MGAKPIIYDAQEREILPKPCTLVMFDAHDDATRLGSACMEKIREMRDRGITLEALMQLCQDDLRRDDGDWVMAGAELGLIGDAVSFGVEDREKKDRLKRFEDHLGNTHRIELMGLPGEAFAYKGGLIDHIRRDDFSDLWDILQWEHVRGRGFRF